MIDVKIQPDPMRQQVVMTVRFDDQIEKYMPEAIFGEMAAAIAKRYVDENYSQIAAKLDQQAIANLAVAQAAKTVSASVDMNARAVVAEIQRRIERQR